MSHMTQKKLESLPSPPKGEAWHVITPTGGHSLGLNAKSTFDRVKAWDLSPKGTKVVAEVFYGPSSAGPKDIREVGKLKGTVKFTAPGTRGR